MFLEPWSASRSSRLPTTRGTDHKFSSKTIAPRGLKLFVLPCSAEASADQGMACYQAPILSGGCCAHLVSARNMHDDRSCHMGVSLCHRVFSFLFVNSLLFRDLNLVVKLLGFLSIFHVSCAFSFNHRLFIVRSCGEHLTCRVDEARFPLPVETVIRHLG